MSGKSPADHAVPETLRSVLLGTSAIGGALAAALVVTLARPFRADDAAARDRVVRLLLVGVAAHCCHFIEEFVTGFYVAFPRLLGLAPWTPDFFVAFNLFWIAVWVLAAAALREGVRVALWPIWFFAIAAALNGVAHPLLSLGTRGYFPGLVTSPVVGVAGVLLWSRLLPLTRE